MTGAVIHACNAGLVNGFNKILKYVKNVTLDAINARQISLILNLLNAINAYRL
jgi:hypothetical protein